MATTTQLRRELSSLFFFFKSKETLNRCDLHLLCVLNDGIDRYTRMLLIFMENTKQLTCKHTTRAPHHTAPHTTHNTPHNSIFTQLLHLSSLIHKIGQICFHFLGLLLWNQMTCYTENVPYQVGSVQVTAAIVANATKMLYFSWLRLLFMFRSLCVMLHKRCWLAKSFRSRLTVLPMA